MIFALILALASAVATNLAFLFKQRGAVAAPPIEVRQPLRSAIGLFRSRWFLVGWMVAIVAWGLHVGALSPWTLTALIAGVISFYASARSLQIGEGVEVIAITSVAANLAAIFGGIIVFHEPIGSGPPEIGARFLAFCLVIAGAALMPAPTRASQGAD